MNKAFTIITGYTESEVIGKNPRLLKSGQHNAEFYAALWKNIKDSDSWAGEVWNRHKNGEIYPEWLTITAVKNSNNLITHYVATHIDISERKQTEEIMTKLSSSFAHLSGKAFFEAVCKDAAKILGLDFVFVGRLNPNGQSISVLGGCAKGQSMGALSYDLSGTPCANVMGKQVCYYPANVQQLFPHDELLQTMGIEGYMGISLFSKDGQPVGIMACLHSRALTHIERIQQIFSIYTDRVASELQRSLSESALRESEDAFRHLFEDSADPILLIKEGRFIDCNNATLTLLGYQSKAEFINCRPSDISPKLQPDGRDSEEKASELIQTAVSVNIVVAKS